MKPFVIFPIIVVNNENESKQVDARVDFSDIDYYYPGIVDENTTVIVKKSGSSFLAPLTITQMDAACESYRKVGRLPAFLQNNGNLKLTFEKQESKSNNGKIISL